MKGNSYKVLMWVIVIMAAVAIDYVLLMKLNVPKQDYVKLGLGIFVLEIAGIIYLGMELFYDNGYKADMVQITPQIQTPARFGQGQHGNAKWLSKKKYDKKYDHCVINKNTNKIRKGGLVIGKEDLGHDREKIYFIGNDTHTISLGSTRSGKTRCEVLQTIGLCALAGESILVTDPKGELYDYTAPFLLEQGYNVHVIDFDEQNLSDSYNLLQPVIDSIDENDVPGAVDKCWDIVSQMVGEAKGERIWNDGECCAIAGAIMAVCYDNRDPRFHKYRNLTNVYHFIVEMCTPIGEFVPLNFYRALLPDTHPCKAVFAPANIAPSKTRGSFYTAALLTLRMFTNPNLYNLTNHSDFSLDVIGKEKTALFVILPEDRTTYNSIATLFITQTYSALSKLAKSRGGRLPVRVEMIWDEFGNFAKIPAFTQMLTVAGGKGIRFHLFLQDYAQLDSVYEKDAAKTIRNNCESKVYLRSADQDTREIISKDLGDYTTKGYSLTYNKNRMGSSSSNSNLVGRRLLTADEIDKIERPYSLIMRTSVDPAIMYAPDLSQWLFNKRFGMGDEEHNIQLRIKRHEQRTVKTCNEIELWGMWKKYQEICRQQLNKMKEG